MVLAAYTGWWVDHNPLPDGHQNEPIHMKNGYQLWVSWTVFVQEFWGAIGLWWSENLPSGGFWAHVERGEQWTLRHTAYMSPWPFGYQLASWPGLFLLGTSRWALMTANLLHLGLLIGAMASLGRSFGARWAPVLVVLCPGVLGSLVRYEPNLANVAWVAAGLACLVRSGGLRSRKHVLGWGTCLGVGLMMDRLTVGFFLVPAVLPLLRGTDRKVWKNVGLGIAMAGLISVAYYREFVIHHLGELLPQVVQGEIDSAGDHTEASRGIMEVFYYPLSLLDSQAGPILGGLMLFVLGSSLIQFRWKEDSGSRHRSEHILLAAVLVPVLFFSLLSKKQLYYTLPILVPMAVLLARRERLAQIGLVGGLWVMGAQGLGVLPSGFPAGAWMPEAWVSPRHELIRPPSFEQWPIEEVLDTLQEKEEPKKGNEPGFTFVYSEDGRFPEKYLELLVSARIGADRLRGLVEDHHGAYEDLNRAVRFVVVCESGAGWPSADGLRKQLVDAAVALDRDPDGEFPVDYPDRVASVGTDFEELARYPYDGADIVVFQWIPSVVITQ